MTQTVELNQGEILLKLTPETKGKLTFADLGLRDEDLSLPGGNLRLVFNFENFDGGSLYQMPTVELGYKEEMGETHWQCEFNGETILDTTDHHGHTTVMLMSRKKIQGLEQHHENRLIVHGEFPAPVHLLASKSYVHFF